MGYYDQGYEYDSDYQLGDGNIFQDTRWSNGLASLEAFIKTLDEEDWVVDGLRDMWLDSEKAPLIVMYGGCLECNDLNAIDQGTGVYPDTDRAWYRRGSYQDQMHIGAGNTEEFVAELAHAFDRTLENTLRDSILTEHFTNIDTVGKSYEELLYETMSPQTRKNLDSLLAQGINATWKPSKDLWDKDERAYRDPNLARNKMMTGREYEYVTHQIVEEYLRNTYLDEPEQTWYQPNSLVDKVLKWMKSF